MQSKSTSHSCTKRQWAATENISSRMFDVWVSRGGLQLVHFSPRHSSTMLWRCFLSIALNKWICSLVDGYGLVNVLIIWITQTHMWISMPHSCLSNQNNQDEHLAENTRDRTAISVQLYKTVWITRGDSLSWAVWLIWQEDPTGENTEAKVLFDGTRATYYTSMSYGVTSATAQVLKADHPLSFTSFLYFIIGLSWIFK